MGRLSKQDTARIMVFVVRKLNTTQKTLLKEFHTDVKSATSFVNFVAEKHSISKTAVWHAFRGLLKNEIVIDKDGSPRLSKFGEQIKLALGDKNE